MLCLLNAIACFFSCSLYEAMSARTKNAILKYDQHNISRNPHVNEHARLHEVECNDSKNYKFDK